jgi:hypothetical protein
MKIGINIALAVAAIFLAYKLFRIIEEPIKLKAEHKLKRNAIIAKLEDVRKAQFAYKEVKHKFAGNWDSLISTIKFDQFRIIRTIGDPNDSTIIVQRDTLLVPIIDSIFTHSYPVDSLRYIPFTKGKEFKLEAGTINQRGVDVHVFQVTDAAPYDKDNVLRLGSMTEVNYSGNWK